MIIFIFYLDNLKKLKTKNLLVTRGKNGAILINSKNDKLVECPAYANNVVDSWRWRQYAFNNIFINKN